MADARMIIAKNIADMLKNGDFVNLGIGIPTMVSKFIDPKKTVLLHGENGSIGQDGLITGNRDEIYKFELTFGRENGDWQRGHRDLCNAGCDYITLLPGGCCFDSAMSFIMARGGHLDATVLGGLQVDTEGNLANWMVPGKRVNGMGGAMDLVCGAKRVIVAMEHTSKDGEHKLLKKCTFPLTAAKCVSTVVTELCIIDCENGKFIVKAIVPGITRKELQEKTGAPLTFANTLEKMQIPE